MMLKNTNDVREFLDIIDSCEREVWLASPYGEYFNLKEDDQLMEGLARLEQDHDNSMEFFAACPKDEGILMRYILRKCA